MAEFFGGGSMDEAIKGLTALLNEVTDLRHAASVIEWDERVYMPHGGARTHGEMLATVRRLEHERFTSAETGRLLDDAKARIRELDRDSDAHRLVAVTARDYDKATRVPAAFVAEQAQVISTAHQAWVEARATSAFTTFEPHLQTILDLKRRYAGFFPEVEHPYDALLDDFEPGLTTADVRAIFNALRPRQVELVKSIASRPQVDEGILHLDYPEKEMWDFGVEVVTSFGFDWTRGRQDKSVHPFATAASPDDVRITTRFDPKLPFALLFGTLHETGHGLYEQGVSPRWNRSALEGGVSLGVHESQSRLWENLVGRSLPFWECFFPRLRQRFPQQLGNVTVEQFYRAINKVEPSLIRVDADEATYNLHVMLRVELEIALLAGELAVKDLPDAWNSKMKDYVGVVPKTAAQGVLQDIHWSIGLFGYFGTYTLGNLISVQLWDAYGKAEPSRDDQIRRGEFSGLLRWLRRHVHEHGRKYQPQEVVERATGRRIDSAPYLDYLDRKFRALYGL
jgi:carboxypeptidase Taq